MNSNAIKTLPAVPEGYFWRITQSNNHVFLQLRKKLLIGSRLIDHAVLGKIKTKEIVENKENQIAFAAKWIMERSIPKFDVDWVEYLGDYAKR